MSWKVKYSGEFVTRLAHAVRCDILVDTDETVEVEDLTFPGREPLVIQWDSRSKEEPICGSSAKLTIESPGDRTYIGLYSVAPCRIRLDVHIDEALYWSGCLDPEFYEEPYDKGFRYDVSLTFSDFGVLGRIPYDLSDTVTLRAILLAALDRACLGYTGIDESLESTTFTDGASVDLASLSIMSANFYDEDGEAMSYEEVLEGILQPLGLRMVQRAGRVYVYDLNGLATKGGSAMIQWDGTDSILGTDKVYNNIRITFSPYEAGGFETHDFEYGDENGSDWSNLGNDVSTVQYRGGAVPSGRTAPECYSWYPDYDEDHRRKGGWDYNNVEFTLFRSNDSGKCTGLAEIGTGNRYFKILPVLGGSECQGVAGGFYTGGHGNLKSGYPVLKGISPTYTGHDLAMRTERIQVPEMSSADAAYYYIRIRQEIMVDARYNPFEEASEGNEKGNYKDMGKACSMLFIPFSAILYNENGQAIYHYYNKDITVDGRPGDSIAACKGVWRAGAPSWDDAWLAYYDPQSLTEPCIGGWKANRQSFGKVWADEGDLFRIVYYDGQMNQRWWSFDSFARAADGQYIPYPPAGGYLEIRIYNGLWMFHIADRFSTDKGQSYFDMYDKIRWWLYKAPEVSLVRRTLDLAELETEDVEYSGVCNVDAKEALELDTVCGTMPDTSPSARGVYIRTSTGDRIRNLVRNGRTDCPEHLLIGTLYSQYADRMTTLRGETLCDYAGLGLYSDAAQEAGRRFMVAEESQDIISDCSDATFVEVSEDEYEGRNG